MLFFINHKSCTSPRADWLPMHDRGSGTEVKELWIMSGNVSKSTRSKIHLWRLNFQASCRGGEYAMCQKFRKFYFVKLVLSKCTCKSLFCSFWRSDFGGWSHKLTLSIRPSVCLEKRQEIACQRFGRHPEGLSRLMLFREIGLISFVKSVSLSGEHS